jgi:cyanophycinase
VGGYGYELYPGQEYGLVRSADCSFVWISDIGELCLLYATISAKMSDHSEQFVGGSTVRFPFIVSVFVCLLGAQLSAQGLRNSTTVGPSHGTIILGSAETPSTLANLIEAAGGPDALIIYVPTASRLKPDGPIVPIASSPEARLKAAGAKNVVVLHTFDRKVADSDSFVEPIKNATGVWFGGGFPEYLLDTYVGTKAEAEFQNVLSRGGVVGGVSAGAMVLASDTVNSSLGADRQWVVRKGFGFLRGVAFQPHAQVPKPESWMLKRPDLLRIAADNSTAWVVRGDVAEIIGEGKAYVYREDSKIGDTLSLLTLSAGLRFDLSTRVIRPKD